MPRIHLPYSETGRIGLLLVAGAWSMQVSAGIAIPPVPRSESTLAGAASLPSFTSPSALALPTESLAPANFLGENPSQDARRVANWAISSGDHGHLPFVVIDKIRAKLFVFDANGRLRGASMALLGLAHGDDTVPGIGTRKLGAIRPEERVTPAGRFVASLGHDLQVDILWVDYDAAISLHRVVTGNPGDHRRERLATTSTLDKRISYGCINVPVIFYEGVILKVFTGTSGIVYILPEVRKLQDVFALAAPREKN